MYLTMIKAGYEHPTLLVSLRILGGKMDWTGSGLPFLHRIKISTKECSAYLSGSSAPSLWTSLI